MLADDMGLGKTLQALCVLDRPALVVAPRSVLFNWADEIARFRPELEVSTYHGPGRELGDAIGPVLLGEPEDTEPRAVTMLGMATLGEQSLGEESGVDPDRGGPVEDPLRRPLGVQRVSARHVLGDRRVPASDAAASMHGHAASEPEDLDGGGGGSEPELDVVGTQAVRRGVVVSLEFGVVVDAECDPLPLSVLVWLRRERAKRGTIESLEQLEAARRCSRASADC